MDDIYAKCWHPQYEKARKELEDILPFHEDFFTYYKEVDEKLRTADLYGKTVLVTKKQFPEIYELSKELQIEDIPIYIYEDFYYGVEAKGATTPWIEISAKTVNDLSLKEIKFLLARQAFRIENDCMKLDAVGNQAYKFLKDGIFSSDALAKSALLKFAKWSRLLNYSADNFGYTQTMDLSACIRSILILILNNIDLAKKINLPDYLAQAEKINELTDIVSIYTKADEKVPYGPFRIKNLISFAMMEE